MEYCFNNQILSVSPCNGRTYIGMSYNGVHRHKFINEDYHLSYNQSDLDRFAHLLFPDYFPFSQSGSEYIYVVCEERFNLTVVKAFRSRRAAEDFCFRKNNEEFLRDDDSFLLSHYIVRQILLS